MLDETPGNEIYTPNSVPQKGSVSLQLTEYTIPAKKTKDQFIYFELIVLV